jgi:hypothetical protein
VNSLTLKSFWQQFHALPPDVRLQARQAFARFQGDPFDPPLQFKEIKSRKGWWSVRVDGGYRALGMRQDDTIIWFWIGTHDEYLRRIGKK